MFQFRKKLSITLALLLALTLCLGSTVAFATEAMYPIPGDVKLSFLRTTDPDIANAGYTTYADAPGFKAWQEATGVDIDIIEVADNTALLLLLASGDLPDIVFGGKNFYTGGQTRMETDGIAIDLTDLLPQYAPDYWKFINSSNMYIDTIRATNGKIYAVAGFCFQPNSPYRSWRGFIMRQDMLDQLSVPVPETLDEFYNVLVAMKEKLGVTTPLCSAQGNNTSMLIDGVITSPFGLVTTAAYQVDGKFHYGAYEKEYKDVLTFMNKLYNEKLFDNNFAVTDEPTAQSSIINGDSGVIYAANSRINNLTKSANNENFKLVGAPALTAQKGERSMFGYADPYVTSSFWSYLSADCTNVEAALQFLNYTFTEKGHILYNFGTEGVSYEMVDGLPKFTELLTNNPNGYALDPVLRANGLLNFTGVQDAGMSKQRFPLEAQVEAFSTWSNTDVDKYMIVIDGILPEYVNEYASLWVDIESYINESRAKFISGATSLDAFDDYLATLKQMGMDRIIEIRQLSLDAAK